MSDGRHGLNEPAGIDFAPGSRFHHGRFGRYFRNLDPADYSREALEALAATMVDPNQPAPSGGGWRERPPDPNQGDNPGIPAGYTYLGQFIDHDTTFDPASSLLRFNDPNALHNFRTPRFDLDNLYGEGPDDEPFLYDLDSGKQKMLVERTQGPEGEFDLPRNTQGTALIGDPRNDENTIVSQLQTTMLRAHNRFVDAVGGFEEARRQLRWHYQYVVVNDFLPRIVPPEVLSALVPEGEAIDWCRHCSCAFHGNELPFMPVEHSVAAYRFGHSMVRPHYDLNEAIVDRPIFAPGSQRGDGQDLRGFQPLIEKWGVDWSFFFELGDKPPQASRLIDTNLAEGLASLPDTDPPSLALRNLLRGVKLGLPWGEAVARRLGETPLTAAEVGIEALEIPQGLRDEFKDRTPLWYYVLREAEVRKSGLQLGPVGGWIVAQTLLCLLAADPFAYPSIDPSWSPKAQGIVAQEGDGFEMADLIRFAIS